jgi:hypothetical protein
MIQYPESSTGYGFRTRKRKKGSLKMAVEQLP